MSTASHAPESVAARVSRQTKLLAALITAILLVASFVAAAGRPADRRPIHYLGIRGLELAAFTGGAQIYLLVPPPQNTPPGESQVHLTPAFSPKNFSKAGPLAAYSKAIRCQQMSLEIENQLNVGSQSTGSGAGKVTFNPVSLKCAFDKTTPYMLTTLAAGEHYQAAYIAIVHPAAKGNPAETLTLKLKTVALKTLNLAATAAGASETITFEYGSLAIQYARTGAPGEATPVTTPAPTDSPTAAAG